MDRTRWRQWKKQTNSEVCWVVPSCPRVWAGPSTCSCCQSSTPSPGCWNTPADWWPCVDGWRCASSWNERPGVSEGHSFTLSYWNWIELRTWDSLWLLSTQTQEEIVDEGGELVADQDPVLVDQVVGGDVGVGSAEGLLQRVSLEGWHHVMLCKTKTNKKKQFRRKSVVTKIQNNVHFFFHLAVQMWDMF